MKLFVNPDKIIGKIKPMNAVNNGPVYTENADQNLTNLPYFKEANIPYARTHDSSICYDYGGEHTVDIINIFTDFDADPYSPESYDFTLTDMYLDNIARSPHAKLVFMTPCKTSGKHEKDIPASGELNHLGLTQIAYVKAMLEVCDHYSVPVIDLYAQSGISPFLPEHRELYMPDGLHYSPAGYERLAHRIAAGLVAVCR